MKKYLSILVGLMIMPLLVFAANDVTLTGADVQLTIGSYTLVVSGNQRVIDSITIDSSSFDLVLSPGATFGVTSADRRNFTVSPKTYVTVAVGCSSSESSLTVTATQNTGSQTVTVTPSTTETCTALAGGGAAGGGGGGGQSSSFVYGATPATPATPAVTPATPAAPAVAAASAVAQAVSPVFNKNIAPGAKSDDVKRVQQLLAQDKEVYPEGLATGFFGSLTKKAVVRFQLKYKVISSEKDAGAGNVGPKTRAKLSEVYGGTQPAAPAEASPTEIQALQNQVNALMLQVQALLKQLGR